jgi:hypothetical protein
MDCNKCKKDIDELIDYGCYGSQEIECSNCGNKMSIEYEEFYNDETSEEFGWWQIEEPEE